MNSHQPVPELSRVNLPQVLRYREPSAQPVEVSGCNPTDIYEAAWAGKKLQIIWKNVP